MDISNNTILIVNATLIAGILILQTLSSQQLPIRPLEDWNNLQFHIESLKTEKFSLEKTIEELEEKKDTINDEERKRHIQTQIDDTELRLMEVNNSLEQLGKKVFKIKEDGKVYDLDKIGEIPSFESKVQVWGTAMIISFIISSMVAIGSNFVKNESKKPKTVLFAMIISGIGLAFLIFGLIQIFSHSFQIELGVVTTE